METSNVSDSAYFYNWRDALKFGQSLIPTHGSYYIYPNGAFYFVTPHKCGNNYLCAVVSRHPRNPR